MLVSYRCVHEWIWRMCTVLHYLPFVWKHAHHTKWKICKKHKTSRTVGLSVLFAVSGIFRSLSSYKLVSGGDPHVDVYGYTGGRERGFRRAYASLNTEGREKIQCRRIETDENTINCFVPEKTRAILHCIRQRFKVALPHYLQKGVFR